MKMIIPQRVDAKYITGLEDEVIRLRSDNVVMREALERYKNKRSWAVWKNDKSIEEFWVWELGCEGTYPAATALAKVTHDTSPTGADVP